MSEPESEVGEWVRLPGPGRLVACTNGRDSLTIQGATPERTEALAELLVRLLNGGDSPAAAAAAVVGVIERLAESPSLCPGCQGPPTGSILGVLLRRHGEELVAEGRVHRPDCSVLGGEHGDR